MTTFKVNQSLSTCACCSGISVDIPARIYNRPGLSRVSYRIGDHPRYKEALLARLTGSRKDVLKKLTTRNNSDFTIALFDAWAIVADILTFYQERLVNESYLRTSTERRSILELANLLGYKLSSGVAASVYIAFSLEDTPGALTLSLDSDTADGISEIKLESGIKIQSIPGPEETAQIFETVNDANARPEWNFIKPRLTQKQNISFQSEIIYLKGISTGCEKGDTILIVDNDDKMLKRIIDVTSDINKDNTCIKLSDTALLPSYQRPTGLSTGSIKNYDSIVKLDQSTMEDILFRQWYNDDLSVLLELKKWSEPDFLKSARMIIADEGDSSKAVYVFRKNTFVFGYNAVKKFEYDTNDKLILPLSEWDLEEDPGNIYLDDGYDELVPGGYLSIQNAGDTLDSVATHKIVTAEVLSRTEYGLSAKTTHLTFSNSDDWWSSSEDSGEISGDIDDTDEGKLDQIRGTKVYSQSEKLELTDLPIEDLVSEDTVTLDGLYLGLRVGQKLIISGEVSDPAGNLINELKEIKQIFQENGYTIVQFKTDLSYSYIREKLGIYANVVLTTHGETVEETLGNGDATQKFQKFTLKGNPLTYISSSSASGSESSLEIRVNDILWNEVESFYGCKANDKVYVTKTDNDAYSTIYFGDGVTGARLPGGQDNVKAKYRKGLGSGGILRKEQISQLLTKPLGVKSAVNPMVSSGGADQEKLENARKNAPLSVLSLDRIVSLQDFEDHTRAFAGIDKALATWSWKNQKRCIYLTISGANGLDIKKEDTVYKNLSASLRKSSSIAVPVEIESYRKKYFTLEGKIKIDPAFISKKVLESVESKLRQAYSFDKRGFGQSVSYSGIVSDIHSVSGVIAADIDYLYYSNEPASENTVLEASLPVPGDKDTLAAELLTIDPRPLKLDMMS